MSTNASNDETPRTTYPIPAEMIDDAFEGDDVRAGDNEILFFGTHAMAHNAALAAEQRYNAANP